MKLRQITAVTDVVEPIEVDDLRQHLRVEHNDEDSYISMLIPAVRGIAESYIDGIISDRVFQYSLDQFTSCIELPVRPIDIDSITISYTDDEGGPQTVASFDVESTAYSATLKPDYGEAWPSVETSKDNVVIQFTAGYGAAFGEVPAEIKHALYMLASTLYDQREDHTAGIELKSVPTSSSYLLDPYRKVIV